MDTDRIRYWLFADRIPLTKALIVTNILTFIYVKITHSLGPFAHLVFVSSNAVLEPWTFFTYPIVSGSVGFLGLLFACYWMWFAAGSLERTWGSAKFTVYFAELAAISAVALYVGGLVIGGNVVLAGLLLVLAGVTVAFGMLNPETIVLLMFILPLKLKYLALISAAMAAIGYASQSPLLGLFALAGCAFSYWYVRSARYSSSTAWPERRGEVIRVHERESVFSKLNPLKWFHRRQSQKRLRKLFEDSGLDQDDQR